MAPPTPHFCAFDAIPGPAQTRFVTTYREDEAIDASAPPAERMRAYLRAIGQGPRAGRDLTREEARDAASIILDQAATRAQMGGFLLLQRFKGESIDELIGFAEAARERANRIRPNVDGLLDVGSPYDGRKKSVVVSPASSIVAAAAGVPVFMHGEKDLGPKHGVPIGDVLESLGVDIDGTPESVARRIESDGIGYLRQARLSPDLHRLRDLREEVALRTFFATVEKIWNPAGADYSIIGLAHLPYMQKMISAAVAMGFRRVLVIRGIEGNEDAPTSAPCRAFLWNAEGEPEELRIDASEYGLQPATKEEMAGGTAAENAAIAERILDGEKSAHRDLVLLNAGVRIWLAERAPSIAEGIDLARKAIDSRAAKARLDTLRSR